MFNVLNKEAFENIEEWRQAYRTELIAAMRAEINPNIAPIQSNSQLIKDSEETICKEVNECLANIKNQAATKELEEWKTEYINSAKLDFLDAEVAKLGYAVIAHAEYSARIGRPPKRANIGEKRTHSGSCSSSRAPSAPTTPPNVPQRDLEKTPTTTQTYGKKRGISATLSPEPLTYFVESAALSLFLLVIEQRGNITLSQPDDTPMGIPKEGPSLPNPTTAFMPAPPITTINGPMEQDLFNDLLSQANDIHGKLPGVNASMHVPHNREASEAPSALPQPTPTPTISLPAEATGDVHPSIVALFNHLQASFTMSFNNIFACLDNQDQTIATLSAPKDPCHKANTP